MFTRNQTITLLAGAAVILVSLVVAIAVQRFRSSPLPGSFDFTRYKVLRTPLPYGQYTMWMSTPRDDDWARSEARKNITAVFEQLDGYQTYVYGRILSELGESSSPSRVALPEELTHLPLVGEDGTVFVLSASAEKGVRLHFGIDENSIAFRDFLWRKFAAYAAAVRGELEKSGVPRDEQSDGENPLLWWRMMEQVNATARKEAMANAGEKAASTQHFIGVFLWTKE